MQPTVPDVSALVNRWVAQEIITAEQADKIRADLAASGFPARTARPVSLVAEGLGYLGGVIVIVGLALVLGLSWDALSAVGKVAVAVTVLVALAVAGAFIPVERLGATGARLRAVLWTGAAIAVAAALGLTADELLHWSEDDQIVLLATGGATVASAGAWLVSRHVLQHLSTITWLLITAWNGTLLVTDSDLQANVAVWAIGVVWFVLGLLNILPRRSAAVVGSIGVMIGGLLLMSEDWGTLFALGTAVALVAIAVLRRELAVLGVGSVGTLIALPIAVDEYFPGVLPAALSLVAGGLALVAIAILTARRRRGTPSA